MDIKPENFIHMSTESRGPAGQKDPAIVKLLDFGLAWADVSTAAIGAGTQLGCSKYLAPELFRLGTNVDPQKCDMYALGELAMGGPGIPNPWAVGLPCCLLLPPHPVKSVSANNHFGCSLPSSQCTLNHNAMCTRFTPGELSPYLGVSLYNLLTGRFPYNFGRIGRPRSKAPRCSDHAPAMH